MKILQIEITNFRQYRGQHVIEISADDEKHITIIQGENGRGKSNIMNAVTWCLYGVELIASKENDKLKIINEREIYSSKDGSARCEVSVVIGNSSPEYKFTRHQDYSLLGKVIKELPPKLEGFKITKEKGTSQLGDPEFYINKVFVPEALKNFFFFDGEKLFEHFKDTQKLKSYIEDLSQIQVLNKALETANSVKKAITTEQNKVTSNQELITEYNGLDAKIAANKKLMADEIAKKIDLESEISEIDEYLKNCSNTQVKELQQSRTNLELKRTKANQTKKDCETKLRQLLGNSIAPIYAARALTKTRDLIEENTKKGVLPPDIKDTFLKELLETGKCICGRNLDDGSECRKVLENLLKDMVASDIAMDAVNGKFVVESILNHMNFIDEYSTLSDDLETSKSDLEEIKAELAIVSEKLSALNLDEIKRKENRRKMLSDERDGCIGEITQYERSIALHQKRKETLRYVVDDILKKNARAKELQQQKQYIEDIIEKIESVKHSLVDDVRIQLEQGVKKYYTEMVSKNTDDMNISIRDINGTYRLSVKSEFGNEKIGSLSAGEKQVLALSMTAAMYTICKVNAPVLIDTPMGRISGNARDNISDYLPRYLRDTQLIFLPTDTEYTPNVREKLLPYVGREYIIKYDDNEKESKVVDYE